MRRGDDRLAPHQNAGAFGTHIGRVNGIIAKQHRASRWIGMGEDAVDDARLQLRRRGLGRMSRAGLATEAKEKGEPKCGESYRRTSGESARPVGGDPSLCMHLCVR